MKPKSLKKKYTKSKEPIKPKYEEVQYPWMKYMRGIDPYKDFEIKFLK